MNIIRAVVFLTVLLIYSALSRPSAADDRLPADSRILAVVPVAKTGINRDVYRKFDSLVPELKKISKSSVIKLECRYSGKPEREQDVLKAYQLAGSMEKYLREHHKLDLDLWITISLNQKKPKTPPALAIAVFAGDMKPDDAGRN